MYHLKNMARNGLLAGAAALMMLPAAAEGCRAQEAGDAEKKIAGYYICFEDGEEASKAVLKRGILTIQDGMIAQIDEYDENQPGTVYLDEDCVMLPGLLDLHSHPDYNFIQLWENTEADEPWDNRFEWRSSAKYYEDIKGPFSAVADAWGEVLDAENGEICLGDLLTYVTELQAAAGGTTLIEGVNDSEDTYDIADSHEKIMLIRSTGLSKDLGREDSPAQNLVQIYVPDAQISAEDQSTYLPPLDTSSWQPVPALNKTTQKGRNEELLEDIGNKSTCGCLIHMAEGRAGNLSEAADPYSRKEFEVFMKEISEGEAEGRFTAEDVRNAHISLIHACAVDPENEADRSFLQKYGIGLIWSPVSNLILYADTPGFSQYLNDPDLEVAIGSDWSPSGSKTVWDECKFAYELIQNFDEENKETREGLLKACTITPARMLGESRFGNIKEGGFADLFIMRTPAEIEGDLDIVLDTFVTASDEAAEGVVIRGKAVCGESSFVAAYEGEDKLSSYGRLHEAAEGTGGKAGTDGPAGAAPGKVFYIPELFRGRSLPEIYGEFEEIVEEKNFEISKVQSSDDPYYIRCLEELAESASD